MLIKHALEDEVKSVEDEVKTVESGLKGQIESIKGNISSSGGYVHPATHPAAMITEDASHRFVTDAEKSTWNGKADVNHTHSYLPLTGGTLTGNLTATTLISNEYLWAKNGKVYLGDTDYFSCSSNIMSLLLGGTNVAEVDQGGGLWTKGSITSEGYLWAKNGKVYLSATDYFKCAENRVDLLLNNSWNSTFDSNGLTTGNVISSGSITAKEYLWAKNGIAYLGNAGTHYIKHSGSDFTFYQDGAWGTSKIYGGSFYAYDHISINSHKIFLQSSTPVGAADGDIWIQL